MQVENTAKSEPHKVENNAWTTSVEQLKSNFEKAQKKTFVVLKFVKTRVPIWEKCEFPIVFVFWPLILQYYLKSAQTNFKINQSLSQTPYSTKYYKKGGESF